MENFTEGYTVVDIKDGYFPVFFSHKLERCIAHLNRQQDTKYVIIRNSDNFKFDRILEEFVK